MLGVADRSLVFDLFETVLKGDAAGALDRMEALYQGGADPVMVLQDLLDLSHFLTRLKLVPSAGEGDPMVEGDRTRGLDLAQRLGMPVLARAWQMLLKGLGEVQTAPSPLQAAEMVLVRLAYVADLPAPADLVKALADRSDPTPAARLAPAPGNGTGLAGSATAVAPASGVAPRSLAPAPEPGAGPRLALAPPAPGAAPLLAPPPQSFLEVVALFDRHREAVLRSHLYAHVHLVHFEPGRIEFRPAPTAPRDLANRLGQLLGGWTGLRWVVSVSGEEGAPSLKEQDDAKALSLKSEAAADPLVRAVLETFPGARIEAVRELGLGGSDEAAAEDPASDDPAEERSEGDEL
jgi:DNA polymerase-3 subunit gamma/tau